MYAAKSDPSLTFHCIFLLHIYIYIYIYIRPVKINRMFYVKNSKFTVTFDAIPNTPHIFCHSWKTLCIACRYNPEGIWMHINATYSCIYYWLVILYYDTHYTYYTFVLVPPFGSETTWQIAKFFLFQSTKVVVRKPGQDLSKIYWWKNLCGHQSRLYFTELPLCRQQSGLYLTELYSHDCSHQYWRIQSFTDEYSRSLTNTVVTVLVSTDEYSRSLMKTNIFSARPEEASVQKSFQTRKNMIFLWFDFSRVRGFCAK